MGDTHDAAPHAGLAQGRTSDAKPGTILALAVKEMSAAEPEPPQLNTRRSGSPHLS